MSILTLMERVGFAVVRKPGGESIMVGNDRQIKALEHAIAIMTERVEPKDRMQSQKDEFDAVADLAKQYRRIEMTPIVDDDYPEVRNGYEGAMNRLLRAIKANGRVL